MHSQRLRGRGRRISLIPGQPGLPSEFRQYYTKKQNQVRKVKLCGRKTETLRMTMEEVVLGRKVGKSFSSCLLSGLF